MHDVGLDIRSLGACLLQRRLCCFCALPPATLQALGVQHLQQGGVGGHGRVWWSEGGSLLARQQQEEQQH